MTPKAEAPTPGLRRGVRLGVREVKGSCAGGSDQYLELHTGKPV